jgi:hypothetical protein
MSTDDTLTTERIIRMTPEEALEKAMTRGDLDAGLVVAVMYQALTGALEDILDEYEDEPEEAIAAIKSLLYELDAPEAPTLN